MKQRHYDIILVDYDLDDGKGFELVKIIRKNDTSIKIIATSAHEEGNRRLLEAGANEVCSKIEFKNISQTIENTDGITDL